LRDVGCLRNEKEGHDAPSCLRGGP
jgi:hypothetical protein